MNGVRIGTEFVPLAVVGFIVGAGLGFMWGKKAKSEIGKSVKTSYRDGLATVQFDVYQAARSGLDDNINRIIDGIF